MSNDSESPSVVSRVTAFDVVAFAVVTVGAVSVAVGSVAVVSVAGHVAAEVVSSTRDLDA